MDRREVSALMLHERRRLAFEAHEDQEFSSIRPLIDWLDYNGYTVVTKATKEFVDASGRRKVKDLPLPPTQPLRDREAVGGIMRSERERVDPTLRLPFVRQRWRSASRLWKLCTSRPSSAYIWGTRRCDMAATATQVVLDTQAAEFRLPATDGKTYALDDVAGEKGTVVVFICNHCPYVKAVIDRMVADARVLMSEGVGFAAICSNDAASYPEDSFENMKRFAKAHDFPFPYLHDETQTVARAYGAVCTPDFFGYNADRKLKYRGRLDEGRTTPPRAGASRELVEAMRAIATTGVTPADQKASIGCSIKWKDA